MVCFCMERSCKECGPEVNILEKAMAEMEKRIAAIPEDEEDYQYD
jgi:hypothetical protein